MRHRLDGPAVEWPDGRKEWAVNGEMHRLDGPAVEFDNGDKEYWVEGKYHSLDGPAVDYINGYKKWFIYDKPIKNPMLDTKQLQGLNNLLKLTVLQNKSRKFNEWLFDPDHYAGKWHKKNMLRDFQ